MGVAPVRDELIGHAEALERIGEAALERDGVRRLVATDEAVATHLATCATCAAERDAWVRLTDALVDALTADTEPSGAIGPESLPSAPGPAARPFIAPPERQLALPPDLRERTLRLAASRGTRRAPAGSGDHVLVAMPRAPERARRNRWRLLAAAAAVVVLVGGGGLVADLAVQRAQVAQQRDAARAEARQLAGVTGILDALLAEPGHRVAALASVASGQTVGSVVWGPSSSRLAVVTGALAAPPQGATYRCWVERDGVRRVIGEMQFGEGLAYWAGWVDPSSGIGPGSRIGVSLVEGPAASSPPPAVLLASF